ncbi:hypothetical protein BX666DRAFT_2014464 [Dichotomocladium elegans]|nr:hypothetical protein BX666DRAFT_2014464 [Dichotomocladium elegans]
MMSSKKLVSKSTVFFSSPFCFLPPLFPNLFHAIRFFVYKADNRLFFVVFLKYLVPNTTNWYVAVCCIENIPFAFDSINENFFFSHSPSHI